LEQRTTNYWPKHWKYDLHGWPWLTTFTTKDLVWTCSLIKTLSHEDSLILRLPITDR